LRPKSRQDDDHNGIILRGFMTEWGGSPSIAEVECTGGCGTSSPDPLPYEGGWGAEAERLRGVLVTLGGGEGAKG